MSSLLCSSMTTTQIKLRSSTTSDRMKTVFERGTSYDCDKVVKTKTWETQDKSSDTSKSSATMQFVWRNIIFYIYLHLGTFYGVYLIFTSAMWQTNLFALILNYGTCTGITVGAHRLWTHRSYKAKLPLRIFLAFLCSIASQNDIFTWVRDHRVHHKYSETNADPHNATRGFFFSHIGWLLCRKHPDVISKGKTVDLSDVLADPVIRFQRKYYWILSMLCCFILPTIIPVFLWSESFINAFFIAGLTRLCFVLHQTWLVNSAAHMWGNRPYDININPRENYSVNLLTCGEGFHNYHHTFPYDYAASEFGMKYNMSTAFIDAMAWLGLAYDRKMPSEAIISARKTRTGENSLQMPKDEVIVSEEN